MNAVMAIELIILNLLSLILGFSFGYDCYNNQPRLNTDGIATIFLSIPSGILGAIISMLLINFCYEILSRIFKERNNFQINLIFIISLLIIYLVNYFSRNNLSQIIGLFLFNLSHK
jgi:H+/Cl- antiporter ClcA